MRFLRKYQEIGQFSIALQSVEKQGGNPQIAPHVAVLGILPADNIRNSGMNAAGRTTGLAACSGHGRPSRPPRGGREGAQGACRTGRVRLCFGNGALFPEPSGVSRHLGMFVLKIFLKPGRSKRVSALLIHTALRADGQGVRGVSRLSCGHFRRQNFRAGHFNFNHLLLMRNLHERHS